MLERNISWDRNRYVLLSERWVGGDVAVTQPTT